MTADTTAEQPWTTPAESSESQPTDVVGMVDVVGPDGIYGWAWSPSDPQRRITINLAQDSRVIATAVADRYRRDLEPHGVGDGHHAFEFHFPPGTDLRPEEVSVCIAGSTIPLIRNDKAVPTILVDDLLRRIIGAERAIRMLGDRFVTLAQQAAVNHDGSQRLERGTADLEGNVAQLREHLAQLEVFALRFDEQMKEMRTRLDAAGRGRRSGPGWLGVIAVSALTLLGSALIAHLLPSLPG